MADLSRLMIPARLGVGPMSATCVDSIIDVATRRQQRIMLIPSRRQVECGELGGGYVEGWTPADLVNYVRRRDERGLVLICRDHGGPWQHPAEQDMSEDEAMRSCLRSFEEDVSSGFGLLHIDTSVERGSVADTQVAIERLVWLYAETFAHAAAMDRNVMFEIGFEDQGVDTNHPRDFQVQVQELLRRLRAAGLPAPTFIVAQTATKVRETENCGALMVAPAAVGHVIRELAEICQDAGSALKSHNADYLSAGDLHVLAANGVSALNVAPELGVAETRALLQLMAEKALTKERDAFLTLAFESGKWSKWMKPDTSASDVDRAVIAGHYVYGTEDFKEIKKRVQAAFDEPIEKRLCAAIGAVVERYLTYFRMPAYAG